MQVERDAIAARKSPLNGPGLAGTVTHNAESAIYAALGEYEYAEQERLGKVPKALRSLPDPVHLYACSLRWHEERDASAGWELVSALRSADGRTRGIAAALLSKTEDARIPARAVRRVESGRNIAQMDKTELDKPMKTPYGLPLIEACSECTTRKDMWFCGLSPVGLEALDGASHPNTYPGGALLFVEGQKARGAFVLCAGRVKLSTTSREGKILIFRIAGPGEVLGLSAVLSGQTYELTAETSGPCHVNFVDRQALLNAIEGSSEFGLRASIALSREFQAAYRDIHDLVLVRSSAGKLARLLLSWTGSQQKSAVDPGARVLSGLTHEEMAQMIGTSRETVTRLLGDLKKRNLIRLDGSTLIIRDRGALEALAA